MKKTIELESVSVRFAGDSGDGMQLVGERFANVSALMGNQVNTFPDFPAEIRPPTGTVAGVSGYQLNLGNNVYTHGDRIDVLVAMNPAAIKAAHPYLNTECSIFADSDEFDTKNLEKAGYGSNPLDDDSLKGFNVYAIPMTSLVKDVLKDAPLGTKGVGRCKNFFALGLTAWFLDHPIESTLKWVENEKFKGKPDVIDANRRAIRAGFEFGEKSNLFGHRHKLRKRTGIKPGYYRFVTGNSAAALGLMAAADKAGRQLFLGSYPITPATEILQDLTECKNYPVRVLQAEDEIAAIGAALGASFAGALAATSTSGPGLALKEEFINLAVISELPLVIINVQRAGPSTGMPTKMEQSDVFQAIWGRNGESPLIVLAARSPSDCFWTSVEGARLALKYMTPVIVLTDGYLSLGADILKVPEKDEIPEMPWVAPPKEKTGPKYLPYIRDRETLARPWVYAGLPELYHRTGGLEKEDITGKYTTDPENHQKMCEIRAKKIAGAVRDYQPTEIFGSSIDDLVIVGWGSSYGAIRQATQRVRNEGLKVAHVHLRYLYPLPKDLGPIIKKAKKILVPENNLGQFNTILRSEYLIETETLHKVKGQPFTALEVETKIRSLLGV